MLGYAVVMICKIVLSGKLVRLSQRKEPQEIRETVATKGRKSWSVFLGIACLAGCVNRTEDRIVFELF